MLKRLCIVIGITLASLLIPYVVGLLLIPIIFGKGAYMLNEVFTIWGLGSMITFLLVLVIAILIGIIEFLYNYIINDKI